jgi:hypothetical protein
MSYNKFPPAGAGLPPGGGTGQVLTKTSAVDGEADWQNLSGVSVASVNSQTGAVVLTTTDIPEGTNLYFPGFPLLAPQGVSPNPSFGFQETGNDTGWGSDTDGAQYWSCNNQEIMRLTNAGLAVLFDLNVTGNISAANYPPTGNANTMAVFNNSGNLVGSPSFSIDTTTLGLNVNITENPNNVVAGYNVHNWNTTITPLQNSPNDSYNFHNMQWQIDPTSTGFTIGTAGQCASIFNVGFTHQGTSNIGTLQVTSSYANIGNGTDPIDLRGYNGFMIFFNNNVNMSQGFQGFIFQPHVHSSATFSTGGTNTIVFADYANVESTCDGWTSLQLSPQITGIRNNNNYNGININPQIVTAGGNAGLYMINVNGSITTMGSSGVTGANFNTNYNVLSANSRVININGQSASGTAEWVGMDVQMGAINTTGNTRGIRINANNDNPTLDHTAIDSTGRAQIQANINLVSGLGQTYLHQIGGSITVPNATAITGTDVIANSMAVGLNTGDATSVWTAASVVGMSLLGFVGQVTGDGTVNGSVNFCLNGFAAANNGPIARINNFFAAAVPGGGTGVISESVLYYGDAPFGTVATDNWGLRIESSSLQNYVAQLAIGTADKKVSNSSIELELTAKAFRLANIDTTARNALTALRGMQIYNTDTDTVEYYNGTSWV